MIYQMGQQQALTNPSTTTATHNQNTAVNVPNSRVISQENSTMQDQQSLRVGRDDRGAPQYGARDKPQSYSVDSFYRGMGSS